MTLGDVAWEVRYGETQAVAPPARPLLYVAPVSEPAPASAVCWSPLQRVAKRGIDVGLAMVGLIVALPIFVVVALAVRLTSHGPVLFRHTRVGRDGKPIKVTKFRTMVPDAVAILEADTELKRRYVQNGFKLHQEDDPRVTKLGRALRRLSLDELPQLWDVLMGRMSLVGPRPVVAEELAYYGDHVASYLAVKPGLTGLWQVGGRSEVAFPERSNIDHYYATRWSLWLDVKVLLRTIPAVVRRRGAY